MPKPRVGDVFSFPIADGRWLTGRVLLDVGALMKRKLIQPSSALAAYNGALLVEVYRALSAEPSPTPLPSEVLVPGAFVSSERLAGGGAQRWPIVGHVAVDPEQVEFPEAVLQVGRDVVFTRGEVQRNLYLGTDKLDRYPRPRIIPAPQLWMIALVCLGMKSLVGPMADSVSGLERSDLRFTDRRDEVYQLLGEDPSLSAAALARRFDIDPARLFR